MIIGIVSDSHNLLREEVIKELIHVDLIIHAGDIGKIELIDKLNCIKPLQYIKGNCDKDLLAEDEMKIKVRDTKIHLLHDKKNLKEENLKDIDIVIYGHSHKSEVYEKNGIIYINPGAIGPRRFKLPISMAKLYIDEDKIHNTLNTEKVYKFTKYMVQIIEISS